MGGGGSIGSFNFSIPSIPVIIEYKFGIKVKVANQAGVPVANLKVEVSGDTTVSGVTDASGLFVVPEFTKINVSTSTIRLKISTADAVPVVLYDNSHTIPNTTDHSIPVSTDRFYVVRGKTILPDNSPLPQLKIELVDKTLGLSVPLAPSTETNESGQYEFRFWTHELFATRGRVRPNIVVRVINPRKELVTTSDIINATGYDEINFTIDPAKYGGPSEYDRYYKIIQPSLTAIQQGGIDGHDLVLLSAMTGGDISQMNHLMEAIRLSDKTSGVDVNAEWLYGLFRRGLPSTISKLIKISRAQFDVAVNDAVNLNIISQNIFSEADAVFNQLLRCNAQEVMVSEENPEVESMLGFVLSCSGLDAERQATLYLTFLTAPKKDDSFWAKAFEDKLINAVQLKTIPLYLNLAFVCDRERGIFETLLVKYNPGHITDLALLEYDDWFNIVQEARTKNKIPNLTPDEDSRLVARMLNRVYDLVPTAVLLYLVKKEQTIRDSAWHYLEDNIFQFDFKDQNINTYIDQHPETLDNYKNDIENLRRSLNRIQRTFLLAPATPVSSASGVYSYRPVIAKALLDLNLDSAGKILRIGEYAFVKYYRDGLQLDRLTDSEREDCARMTFYRAQKQANLIKHLHSTYGTSFNNLPMYAVQQNDERRKDRVRIPGLSTLFEAQEIMGCDHCNSVLSPAAYLVDLLSFLDEAEIKRIDSDAPVYNETTLDILFERRPDIRHLVLNCENTNTPVSYIDLVNEVLENAIADQLEDEALEHGILQYRFRGKVLNLTTSGKQVPLKSAYVQLFSVDATHQQLLGAANTDRYGKFEINIIPENDKPLRTVTKVIYQHQSLAVDDNKLEWRPGRMRHERLLTVDFAKLDNEGHPKKISYLKGNDIWTICGVLQDTTGAALQKYTILAWDEDYGGDDLLGICETDATGNFEINFHSSAYMDGKRDKLPDPYIVVIKDGRAIYLQYLGSNIPDNLDLGLVKINARTRTLRRLSSSSHGIQNVSGIIKSTSGNVLLGMRVVLTNDSLRPEGMSPSEEFAMSVSATDKNGNFSISFDESEFKSSAQQVAGPYRLIIKSSDSSSWSVPAVINTSSTPVTTYTIAYSGAPSATGDRITGKLLNQYDSKPVQGYLIEVWRSEDENNFWVGNAITASLPASPGEFTISTQSLVNKSQVSLFFKLFDGDNFLYQTSSKLFDVTGAAGQKTVKVEVISPYYGDNVKFEPFILKGRVLDEKTANPLQNTWIAFWEKDKGREYTGLQFGTRTDENGNFEVSFDLRGDDVTTVSHAWYYKSFLKDKISFEASKSFKWSYKERVKQLEIRIDTSAYTFNMAKEYYTIQGRLTDKANGQPLPGCTIEAWDKDDNDGDDLLGVSKTDINGYYEITFDSHYFRDRIEDNDPDVYFKVYQGNSLLKREDVIPDMKSKVLIKDLQASPLKRSEVSGQRGPLLGNVYKTLSETLYPWNFPFDLHEAEGHLYLKALGLDKEQVIHTLNPGKDTRFGEALAYLQMSRVELDSLKTGSVKLLYGLGDDEPVTKLNDISFILNTIRISFDIFKDLIGTDYVNPLKKEIRFLTDRTLFEFSKEELLSLHRLCRLQSKCDWKAKELEQVMRLYENRFGALKGSNIDRFIIYLAGMKKLINRGATLPDVLGWQYELHSFKEGSDLYFKKIFNTENPDTTTSALLLNESGQALLDSTRQLLDEKGQISEVAVPVMDGLGVNAEALLVLITYYLPDSKINLTNLSRLFRIVSFCRHLHVSFREYKTYVSCIGFDPLLPSDGKELLPPELFLKFIDEFHFINDTELPLSILEFIYAEGNISGWSEEKIHFYESLRDAFLKEKPEGRSMTVVKKLSDMIEIPEDAVWVFLDEPILLQGKPCKVIDLFTVCNWFELPDSRPVEFLQVMDWLSKWSTLVTRFELTTEDATIILKDGGKNGWYRPLLQGFQTDKANQSFHAWKALVVACEHNNLFRKKGNPTILRIISDNRKWAEENPSPTQKQLTEKQKEFFDNLSLLTGWSTDNLRFMAGTIHSWQFPVNFLDMNWFDQLKKDFNFLVKSGLLPSHIEQMQTLAQGNINANHAEILQLALKSKTPPGQWEEKINQLKDQVREGQRRALQTYLLSRDTTLQNEDDIYAQYLVDTETGTSVQTSRIKQSISSVQLLVQRIRMGLEPGISFNRENMKEWEWRKNYRVWEANRKIFLYPENWLEPELRDDKSQLFKKFEEELMQGEMNAENVEKAFRNYLVSMDEVAHLEMSGFCYQKEGNVYHVFARTRNIPHRYFYRRWVDASYWTPWEEVQVDIAGDHLIPVYWNRKLILFWPLIAEKPSESNSSNLSYTLGTTVKGTPPALQLEIKMAVSHYQKEGWTAKKISEVKLQFPYAAESSRSGEPTYPTLLFQTVTTEDNLFIRAYKDNADKGFFTLSAGTDQIQAVASDKYGSNDKAKLLEGKALISPIYPSASFSFSKASGKNQFKIKDQDILNASAEFLITTIAEQSTDDHALFFEGKDKVYAIQKIKPLAMNLGAVVSGPLQYRFRTFFHPKTGFLKSMLDRYSVEGLFNPPRNTDGDSLISLMRPDVQDIAPDTKSFESFSPSSFVVKPYPPEDLTFDLTDAYASYNWELFFHAPITIALRLSQNQQFEDAQRWFHYIFDPTETEGEAPRRFWRIKPFYLFRDYSNIADIVKALSSDKEEYTKQVENWEKSPFNPHVIARLRIVAYMRMVVMKYLDNLIVWADQLFQRDTIESINEATQIYILASQILGRRPAYLQKKKKNDFTIEEIFDNLDDFSNALVEVENQLPNIDFRDMTQSDSGPEDNANTFGSLLYFCIPQNDHLLSYWETVADRLYKIRQGMNIEGVKRALALFEPPIDPMMLVKATSSGANLSMAISETMVSSSAYRFSYLLPKAIELCNEVKSLGGSLLSALEKKDAEEMALLRSTHEITLLKAVKEIKKKNIEEAKTSIASLNSSLRSAQTRYRDYGRKIDQNTTLLEKAQMASQINAISLRSAAGGMSAVSAVLSLWPSFIMGIAGAFGSPVAQGKTSEASKPTEETAKFFGTLASINDSIGSIIGTLASWERRKEDWQLQKDLASIEIQQIQHQLNGAIIRVQSGVIDLENHEKQIAQAQEVRDLMESKYTNYQLYQWMTGQLSNVYFQNYQMAYDLAKKAEKAFAYELGIDAPGIIEFGYWNSLKKGLMSGEKLQLDLRRLELAYMEQNKREFELSKHISMALFSPSALLDLQEKGVCEFHLPEILFDMDHPSHYMRRIKSISLTIPCITGPYSGVHAQLTLLSSMVRKSASIEDGYAYRGINDSRFTHDVSGIQSIATSSGQNDSGVFELNFRDERYLPFERAGAISTWRLELPGSFRQFNYQSISDVIIHMNYTSKEGGEILKAAVEENIQAGLNALVDFFAAKGTGLQAWISMKGEFSSIFNQLLVKSEDGRKEAEIEITAKHFPYFLRDRKLDGKTWTILVKCKTDPVLIENIMIRFQHPEKRTVAGKTSVPYKDMALFRQAYFKTDISPISKWKLQFESEEIVKLNPENIDDIFLVCDYIIKAEE